jgi:hypothetical protein
MIWRLNKSWRKPVEPDREPQAAAPVGPSSDAMSAQP